MCEIIRKLKRKEKPTYVYKTVWITKDGKVRSEFIGSCCITKHSKNMKPIKLSAPYKEIVEYNPEVERLGLFCAYKLREDIIEGFLFDMRIIKMRVNKNKPVYLARRSFSKATFILISGWLDYEIIK